MNEKLIQKPEIANAEELHEVFSKFAQNNSHEYKMWLISANKWLNIYLPDTNNIKHEPYEIVHDLIDKLFSGKRTWNKVKYPEFNIYFKMIIRSHVYNIANKMENDIKRMEDEESIYQFELANKSNPLNDFVLEVDYAEFLKFADDLIDEDEKIVLWTMQQGFIKNSQIQKELGLAANQVVNIKKRVKRKILELSIDFYNLKKA